MRFQLEASHIGDVLARLLQAAVQAQLLVQNIAQGQQVMGVDLGIAERAFRQRTLRPVEFLVLLAVAHAEQIFQHIAQADALIAADAGSRHRVEDGPHIEIKVALETDEVVFGGVEDLLDGGIGQDGAERTDIGDGQRIDEQVFAWRGQLDEAGGSAIGVHAVGFGIAGDALLPREAPYRTDKGAAVVDVAGGREHGGRYNQ